MGAIGYRKKTFGKVSPW